MPWKVIDTEISHLCVQVELLEWADDLEMHHLKGYGETINYRMGVPLLDDVVKSMDHAMAADSKHHPSHAIIQMQAWSSRSILLSCRCNWVRSGAVLYMMEGLCYSFTNLCVGIWWDSSVLQTCSVVANLMRYYQRNSTGPRSMRVLVQVLWRDCEAPCWLTELSA